MHNVSTANHAQPTEPNNDAGSAKPQSRAKDGKSVGRLMTLRQAAEYFGLSYWLLRDYCLDGILPIVRLPGARIKGRNGIVCHSAEHTIRKILVDRQDIDRLIEESKG